MTSRKQGKNRSRLRRIIDNRRAKRKRIDAADVVIPPVEGESAFSDLLISDQAACWALAKRRKQGREKTIALYRKHMAERGWGDDAALPEGV